MKEALKWWKLGGFLSSGECHSPRSLGQKANTQWAKSNVMWRNLMTVEHPELYIKPPAKFAREMAKQQCTSEPQGALCTKGP